MSDMDSDKAARLEERRRRRQQRRNSGTSTGEKDKPDEEGLKSKINGVEQNVESRYSDVKSMSSTDSDADHRALTREEKRKQRRQKKRDMPTEDEKPVPVISHFGQREIRERKASDADTLSGDSGSVASDLDVKRPMSPSQSENDERTGKKGTYGNYASAIRRGSASAELHRRKDMYAAALEGHPVALDERDAGDEKEESARKPVVKTFEDAPESKDSEGVDSEHVQSVRSLKEQWQEVPKEPRSAPGVNKPKVDIRADKQWIKHVKVVPDEGEAPKEPAWMQMVRHRRWLSTVKARFPESEEEARAFEQRSTTPKKFKKSNPYTLMRSKSDLDDEFEAVMNRRRRKTDDDKRSLSSFSESDMTDYGGGRVFNKVPTQGPLKEYQKNLSLERARKTMMNWTFSSEAVDDPGRFDLPKPIDLVTSEEHEREQEWAYEHSRQRFAGGGDSMHSLRSSSHASTSSLSDEDLHSPRNIRSISVDSGRGYYGDEGIDFVDQGAVSAVPNEPVKSSLADPGLEFVPKLQDIKKKYTEVERGAETKTPPVDEELRAIPKLKDIKERFMAPKADAEKPSSGVAFEEGEQFSGLADIKRKLAEKKDQLPTVLSKPKTTRTRSQGDLAAIMASRRQVTDETNETQGAAEEIKNLASDITRTFGHSDSKDKWNLDSEKIEHSKKGLKEQDQSEKPTKSSGGDIQDSKESKEERISWEKQEGSCGQPKGCATDEEPDESWIGTGADESVQEEPRPVITGEIVPETQACEVEALPGQLDLDDSVGGEDEEADTQSPGEEGGSDNKVRGDERQELEKDERNEDDQDDDPKDVGIEEDGDEDERRKLNPEDDSEENSEEELMTQTERQKHESEEEMKSREDVSGSEDENEKPESDDESKGDSEGSEAGDDRGPVYKQGKEYKSGEELDKEVDSAHTSDEESPSGQEVEDGAAQSSPAARPQSLYTAEVKNKKTAALLLEERPKSYAFEDMSPEADPCLTSNLKSFADHRRKLRPTRKHVPTKNPVRQRQNRADLRTETDILMSKSEKHGIQSAEEMGRPSLPNKRFTDEALAGLSSTENLASASQALRRTQKDKSGISTEVNKLGGFQDVMLIQIKGSRNMQTRLVEPTVKSLNSGDVFVLVKPQEIHVWIGKDANIMKKAKGMEVSTVIVKQKDLNCNANKVNIMEQSLATANDAKARSFWKALGGKAEVADASEFPSDEDHEKAMLETNLVYRINCSSDPPELVLREDLSRQVLSSEFLDNSQAYVTDFGSEVYLWLGRNCPVVARNKGVKLAHDLYKSKFQLTGAISPFDTKTERENGDEVVSVARPKWALFGRMTARSETVLFREKFVDWPDHNVDYTQDFVKKPISGSWLGSTSSLDSYSDVSTAPSGTRRKERPSSIFDMKACDVSSLIPPPEEPSFVLEGFNVGRGDGSVDEEGRAFVVATTSIKIWHVKEYSYQPLPEGDYGHFHSSEGYVVRWKYCPKRTGVRTLKGQQSRFEDVGRDKVAYFFWQGRDCTVNEKGAAALMTVELDSDKGPQVLVSQGKEPPCFTRLFEGKMTIHTGKRDSEDDGDTDAMFIVRNEIPEEVCLLQIPASVSALRSRTSFVVFDASSGTLYVWHGSDTPDDTADAALESAKQLRKWYQSLFPEDSFRVVEMEEGEEQKGFWEALGGDASERTKKEPVPSDHTLRIFQLGSSSGAFEAKEVLNPARSSNVSPFPLLQGQLYSAMQPALFLVDAKAALYLWLGWWPLGDDAESRASTTGSAQTRWNYDRRLAMETSRDYAQELGRDFSNAYVVFAGLEPDSFKSLFPFWEEQPDVAKINSTEGREDGLMLKLEAELAKLSRDRYTLEELKKRPLPEGVDPQNLENYLSADDMQKAFKMTKNEFDVLPNWKKVNLKKKAGLF